MTTDERAKLARTMGLDPVAYEKFRAERAVSATAEMALAAATATPAAPATARGPVDLKLCAQMKLKPEDVVVWRAAQLVEAKKKLRYGETLSQMQEYLLRAETNPPAVIPITPTAEDLALAAEGRRMRDALARSGPAPTSPAPAARSLTLGSLQTMLRPTGTMRMDIHGGRSGR